MYEHTNVVRYRKRPVTIEAFQWTGDNQAFLDWLNDPARDHSLEAFDYHADTGELKIKTLEGVMTASLNDWIIQGVQGEVYPCKPDIFEATYEPVLE